MGPIWNDGLDRLARRRREWLNLVFSEELEKIEQKDQGYTRHHCLAVAELARKIGSLVKLAPVYKKQMVVAGPVHDLGKGLWPDRSPDNMFDYSEEWKETDTVREILRKRHPEDSAQILLTRLRRILTDNQLSWLLLVVYHHWAYNGTGYPSGKVEELVLQDVRKYVAKFQCRLEGALTQKTELEKDVDDLRLAIGVLRVSDALHAATSRHPARSSPKALARALGEIEKGSGEDYHPKVADAVVSYGTDAWEQFRRSKRIQ